ncbi:hypothetical protein ZEAMMB73_Zm00001d039836 [Zea mays]|uniref:Uncharacterized protein n=1 Tax=Zea mays TaxID=4577 RepID=A0A1D6MLA0_MAIZE|nr:hypothetical protein ZEAMMB73_Zm00001d039836 [Zea mays]
MAGGSARDSPKTTSRRSSRSGTSSKLLTRATATATTCTSTTTSGARAPAASPSSTGWMSAKAETCITRNAHEASSTHSSSCTSDQTRGRRTKSSWRKAGCCTSRSAIW